MKKTLTKAVAAVTLSAVIFSSTPAVSLAAEPQTFEVETRDTYSRDKVVDMYVTIMKNGIKKDNLYSYIRFNKDGVPITVYTLDSERLLLVMGSSVYVGDEVYGYTIAYTPILSDDKKVLSVEADVSVYNEATKELETFGEAETKGAKLTNISKTLKPTFSKTSGTLTKKQLKTMKKKFPKFIKNLEKSMKGTFGLSLSDLGFDAVK